MNDAREAIARALQTLACKCGHRQEQHDPEDGECESADATTWGKCLCPAFQSPDPNRMTAEYQADAVLAAVPLSEGWEQVEEAWRNDPTHDSIYYAVENVMRRRVDGGAAPPEPERCAAVGCALHAITQFPDGAGVAHWLCEAHGDALGGGGFPVRAPASSTPTETERAVALRVAWAKFLLSMSGEGSAGEGWVTEDAVKKLSAAIDAALSGQQDTERTE